MSLLDDIREHLGAITGKPPTCPACGNDQWEVTGTTSTPVVPLHKEHQLRVGAQSIPLAVLMCSRCFNVLFFALGPIEQKLRPARLFPGLTKALEKSRKGES